MVDAKHAPQQLDEHHEAQEQVGFADRILITKTDVVPADAVVVLRQRLVHMNPRARIGEARHGEAAIDDLLDIRGFNLNAILEIEPAFLTDVDHEHDDDVGSFVFRENRPLDLDRVEDFLSGIVPVSYTHLDVYKRQHEDHFDSALLRERSLMLAWKPSHMQSLRLQYTTQRDAVGFENPAKRSVQLQYVLAFGAHGAHAY